MRACLALPGLKSSRNMRLLNKLVEGSSGKMMTSYVMVTSWMVWLIPVWYLLECWDKQKLVLCGIHFRPNIWLKILLARSLLLVVSNFNHYKMVDSRPVMEQFGEIQCILGRIKQHDMILDDNLVTECIIDNYQLYGKIHNTLWNLKWRN